MEEVGKNAIGRWVRFESPEMEAAYRESALAGKLPRAGFVLWLTCFGAAIFAPQDYVTFGNTTGFYVGLAVRCCVLAFCLTTLARIRRSIAPDQLEKWMIAFCVASKNREIVEEKLRRSHGQDPVARSLQVPFRSDVRGGNHEPLLVVA